MARPRFGRLALCYGSGAVLGACLWVCWLWPAVFVAAVPALCVLLREPCRRRALCLSAAFALGLCMTGHVHVWGFVLDHSPAVAFAVKLLLYVGGCALHGAILALCLWCGVRLPCGRVPRCVTVSVLWAAGEWLCGIGPLALPTLRLGLALWRHPALIQIAQAGGLLLVGTLIMACNTLLSQALNCALTRARGGLCPLLAAALLLTANCLAGTAALHAPYDGETVSVAAVQPGIASYEGRKPEIYAAALSLAAEAAAARPALLLVPESTLYATFYDSPGEQAQWAALSAESGGTVIAGGPFAAVRDRASGERIDRNAFDEALLDERLPSGRKRYMRFSCAAAFRLDAGVAATEMYLKRRTLPLFEKGADGTALRLLPAAGSQLLGGGALTPGVLLCYESLFAGMARQAAREGAALIAVPSNDSRLACDEAKRMHLAQAVFRAVETGLPLLQAGLNGCTAAVSARGELLAELPVGAPGLLQTSLPLEARRTPYRMIGDAWLAVCLAGLGPLAIRKRNKTGPSWKEKQK